MRPAVVAAALVLAPSGVSCQTILAAGASFPDRVYQDAIFAYSFVEPDVKMTYVPVVHRNASTPAPIVHQH